MKVELEIVTDRLPTEVDGSHVLVWAHDRWFCGIRKNVKPGTPWMRQPPPPKQQGDTSLAASIERLNAWRQFKSTGGIGAEVCRDIDTVIVAARKWDQQEREMQSEFAAMNPDEYFGPDKPNTDPDGVGEGWRLLREGEHIERGDEVKRDNGKWYLSLDPGLPMSKEYTGRYRRRIEANSGPPILSRWHKDCGCGAVEAAECVCGILHREQL